MNLKQNTQKLTKKQKKATLIMLLLLIKNKP